MDAIYIYGGVSLQGQVAIQGSKNAVLPIMAATILTEGENQLHDCPKLRDVYHMQTLLKTLFGHVSRDKEMLRINSSNVDMLHAVSLMQGDAVKGMRSSVILLGALLGKTGEAHMEFPGGCIIGKRPIDLHISSLSKMNVKFEDKSYGLYAYTDGLKGAEISLPFPSVGATENIILAAVKAEGVTVINGAAKEPEISTLCEFLNACGARIEGAGTNQIVIHGVKKLTGCSFQIPGDRIVAGTYMCACMAAGGEVFLQKAPTNQMQSVISMAGRMGTVCQEAEDGLFIQSFDRLKVPSLLKTEPYPGFPTDLQSIFLPVFCMSEGVCSVEETIFENRFHTVPYLAAMGAKIQQENDNKVIVEGTGSLNGSKVSAVELRGGASLVVAGVAAKGETIVEGCRYIERGYENICRDLRELGVRIYGV